MNQNTKVSNDPFSKFVTQEWDALQDRIKALEAEANTLRSQGTPEEGLDEFIAQLRKLERSDVEPSPAEQNLFKLLNELVQEGVSDEEEILEQYEIMVQGTKIQVMADIILSLDPVAKDKFDRMVESGPNMMQFGFALNATAQLLHNRTFDELYEEKLQKAVDALNAESQKSEVLVGMVSKLTDEQVAHIQKMVDMGYGEMANNLLTTYINERE